MTRKDLVSIVKRSQNSEVRCMWYDFQYMGFYSETGRKSRSAIVNMINDIFTENDIVDDSAITLVILNAVTINTTPEFERKYRRAILRYGFSR